MKILIISKFYPPENSARAIQMAKVVASIVHGEYCKVQILAGLPKGDKPANSDCPIKYVEYENWTSPCNTSLIRRIKNARQNLKRTSAWIAEASAVAINLLQTFKPDIILSASSPLDCHKVTLNIIKKQKIPWAAFFSDIMPPSIAPYPYTIKMKPTNFLWLRKLRNITIQTLTKSNAVVMSNELAFSYMSEKLGIDISSKSYIIPHVGDTFLIDKSAAIDTKLLKNRIVHIGLIDKARSCRELLEAARLLHKEMPDKFSGLLFVGNVEQSFVDMTTEEERKNLFIFKGKVPTSIANEYIKQAKSLLLLEADMIISPYLPSKMAEYSVNGHNIVAITPKKSSIRQYIDDFGGGYCASRNIDEIKEALRQSILDNHNSQSCKLAEIFSSTTIAKHYYHMFENILK